MSLTPLQKSRELIGQCTSPLIFLPPFPKTDIIAAAFALFYTFQERGVRVQIICDSAKELTESLTFIHATPEIHDVLSGARDFVLSFNTKYNPISEVRTEKGDDELRIYITPEKASIDPRDFSFQPSSFSHDLVITLGAADKERLGNAYSSNPDVFYEVPIVNVDYQSSNELFGQVNVVDLTASTVSEIVAEIIAVGEEDTKPFIYEYLLAGITSGTDSFQKTNTSPKAFRMASTLMDLGADQQNIVRALYKTQPLHLLKLWGKVMANIKWNEKLSLIWGTVSIQDFVQARASQHDLPLVLEKIKANYQTAKMYMLLHQENSEKVHVLLAGGQESITTVLGNLFPEAKRIGDFLSFYIEKDSVEAAEEQLLETLAPQE
jgi:nanoRNase/pAp phosphatase (c-di-AMP/oligoRNAs hydrolase)